MTGIRRRFGYPDRVCAASGDEVALFLIRGPRWEEPWRRGASPGATVAFALLIWPLPHPQPYLYFEVAVARRAEPVSPPRARP